MAGKEINVKLNINGTEEIVNVKNLLGTAVKTVDGLTNRMDYLAEAIKSDSAEISEDLKNKLQNKLIQLQGQFDKLNKPAFDKPNESANKFNGGVKNIISSFSSLLGIENETFSKLQEGFDKGLEFAEKFKEGLTNIKEGFNETTENNFQSYLTKVKETGSQTFASLKDNITRLKDNFNTFKETNLSDHFNKIKAAGSSAFIFLKTSALAFFATLKAFSFKNAFQTLLASLTLANIKTVLLNAVTKAYNATMNILTNSTKLFGFALKSAFVTSGIGALVIVLAGLIGYFSQTEKGAKKLTSIMDTLTGFFKGLFKAAAPIGELLANVFDSPVDNLLKLGQLLVNNIINRFTSIKDILIGIFSLDFEKINTGLTQAFTGLDETQQTAVANTIRNQVDLQKELTKTKELVLALDRTIGNNIKTNKTAIEENKRIIDDTNASYEKAKTAILSNLTLTEDNIKKTKTLYDAKIEEKKLENDIANNSKETQQALLDAQNAREEAVAEAVAQQNEAIKSLNDLENEYNTNTQNNFFEAEKLRINGIENEYVRQKALFAYEKKKFEESIKNMRASKESKLKILADFATEYNRQI